MFLTIAAAVWNRRVSHVDSDASEKLSILIIVGVVVTVRVV